MMRRRSDRAAPSENEYGRISYEQLPVLSAPFTDYMASPDEADVPEDAPVSNSSADARSFSRRTFIRRTATASLLAVGFSVIDLFGRRDKMVAYAAHSEDFSYLQVSTGKCSPINYAVTCSVGCYLGTSANGSQYCASERVDSRHRAHFETVFLDEGPARMHAIRPDNCHGGYDGWQWRGTDDRSNCGCPDEPRFSCSGGWARYLVDGQLLSWYHTTCQQADCGG